MENAAFAFLDLLGFSEYVKSDLAGAAQLLDAQRVILECRLSDKKHYEKSDEPMPPHALDHLVTSFDHLLPFSDSILIVSGTPDLFVRQLSTFLIAAFCYNSRAFDYPVDPACLEKVSVLNIGTRTRYSENWFPVLWRGGLSFGRVELFDTHAIKSNQVCHLPLLVGRPVASAVCLEKNSGKGPRLFCEPTFKDQVKDPALRRYFRPVPGTKCDELLWPIFLFHDSAYAIQELNNLSEMLPAALNLWKSKRGQPEVEPHYFEFVRLICRSAMLWAEVHGSAEEGRAFIRAQISTFGGESLFDLFLI